ncbi:MAG: YceI family protein [Bacteroidales bacterium]|nr:YceI family protein [Bacteroidales bacterium]
MKINRFFLIPVMATAIVAVSCSQTGTKQKTEESATASPEKGIVLSNLQVKPDQSRVVWFGEMLGLYSHEGTISLSQADLKVQDGKIAGGNFVIDMATITPTDENYNPAEGGTPEKLVGHLSNPDFFDVPNHPTASFEITRMEENSVLGMLTIRGISKEEKVENISVRSPSPTLSQQGRG